MSAPLIERRLVVPKTARAFCLGELGESTREVWIACHGYGQLARRFVAAFEPIVSPTRAVIAPEALNHFYLDPPDRPTPDRRVGATWMTREDREVEIADIARYLDLVLGEIRKSAPAARCIALGFSQGAAAVARWAVAGDPDLARVVLWGSDLPSDLDWERASSRFRVVPLCFVLGDRDEFATPARIAAQEARLVEHGIPCQTVRYPGGHAIDREALARVAAG